MQPQPSPTSPPARALVLAAGRGERMRPLTDTTPKPLLGVHGKPLMQWHLEGLARSGCTDVVVNTAWLGNQISAYFGGFFDLQALQDKRKQLLFQEQIEHTASPGVTLHYSHEGQDFGDALETAGGIARALPLLDGGDPHAVFWVVAGDVFMPDFTYSPDAVAAFRSSTMLAHLWLVPNPAHNPRGDFGLSAGVAAGQGHPHALNLGPHDALPRYTFSTIGLYRAALFAPPWCDIASGNPLGARAPLAPLLRKAMDEGRISAELYHGSWADIGTPERLAAINAAPLHAQSPP